MLVLPLIDGHFDDGVCCLQRLGLKSSRVCVRRAVG
jgi:hypothetical protein